MTRRMWIATVALLGAFVAVYLTLYKLGIVGTIACTTGGCEKVQASRWSTFLGLPVAAWGIGYYLSVLTVAIIGTDPHLESDRRVSGALLALTTWGMLFTGWLNWLEWRVIDAWCQWCIVSAVLVVLLFALSLSDFRARPGSTAPPV
ncbi:MAG: vitamin K epoxide reductase family protein [Gemmatimonadaceae bacterium]|nr:vitamin K epoxide reductase family protein [Gemmatimonadaceae bacterium]